MIAELSVMFGTMLAVLAMGAPVFLAMAAATAAYTIAFWPKVPALVIGQGFVQGLDSYSYAAILFFFLAGEIMNTGGISDRLLRLAQACVGHVRGGLSHINVLVSMVFAGVSGSAVADAAGIGSILIPAMKRAGYSGAYAAAVTAASATIGPVIPPSIPLVVYGLFAMTSVGKLFVAGVVPGLLMGVFLLVVSFWISHRRGYPARPWGGWRELAAATGSALTALLMPVIVVVGLVGGVATVTEVGALACLYAVLVSTLVYRELTVAGLWSAVRRAAVNACAVLVVISVAGLFVWIVGNMGVARALAAGIGDLSADPVVVLALFSVVLLVAGLVLEPVTILVVLVPLMVPAVAAAGIDLVQFGVIAVLATLIGLITPPVGFLIFLTAVQAGASALSVVRELAPFLLALVLLLAALVVFPPLTLWLPSQFWP
ncbi:MAG: TRAP transporter large permease [Hyphomicrobiales bacterium]|nr:TRAP transporter large permease [Hyphomicrobiales bacterium]